MGAKSGRATVKRALKSDHSADDEGTCHSADDYEIIVTHECILFNLRIPNILAALFFDDYGCILASNAFYYESN